VFSFSVWYKGPDLCVRARQFGQRHTVNGFQLLLAHHVCRFAAGHGAAIAQQQDPVGMAHGQVQVMHHRHDAYPQTACDMVQPRHHGIGNGKVQCRGGFIQQ
jgi:hypothetical protein